MEINCMVTERPSRMRTTVLLSWAPKLGFAVILVMVLLCAGCGNTSVDTEVREFAAFASLTGQYVPGQPVTVVPDRFWEADEEAQTWTFRGWASLVVHIDENGPVDPLRFRFVPDKPTSLMHFSARWDQETVGTAAAPAGDGVIINITRENLSPGIHHLKIGRNKSADEPDLREILDCRFTAIEVGSGEAQHLRPSDHRRYELVRAFLEDGVAGVLTQRYGGLLVSGRQMVKVRLVTSADAEISFLVSSYFAPKTRFEVEVDGIEHHVQAGSETVEIKFAIEKGEHEMRLLADGPEQGLYLWGAPNLSNGQPAGQGPVILVTLDTTRKDALSIYGGPESASPNIARLAEISTVFDQAWSTSPWTLPSHASIFTGLYPTRHGAGVSKTRLDTPHPTLAEFAHAAGFRTGGFSGGALSASRWGLASGFDEYRDPDGFETKGDRQTDYVEAFIDRWATEPMFIFVNYFDPHAMYQAPSEFEELFNVVSLRAKLVTVPVWNKVSEGDGEAWRAVVNGEVEPTPEALEYLEAAYLAEVAFTDHQIGRLISNLVEHDLFDSSTIIVVADHGEFLGEGGFFSHACRLDPELTEIPLIIKRPGQSVPKRDDRLISQVDLFGTILDALGVASSPRDGYPIGPGNRTAFDERAPVFMEEHENRIHPLFPHMAIAPHIYGLQHREWRQLVWDGGSSCFDRDDGSWRDKACDVGWQRRLAELAAVAALPVDTELSTGDVGLTDEMREHLEALGYIR